MTQARDLANLISNSKVDGVELSPATVGTTELADAAVSTAKIADGAVTSAKVTSVAGTKITYDNTVSGISANTLQEAVDYLNSLSGGSSGSVASYTRQKFTATSGQTVFTVTAGYQVGYLEVYMNGILLDITDYTASDGSTVVLAAGAAAGDEIVTIALDSFAIAELLRIFSTSASAPDDAVTVDASGNVLVGKTVNNDTTAGFRVNQNFISSVGDGAISGYFHRLNSDGDIVQFRKSGTIVGSIGSGGSSTVYIGGGDTGLLFAPATNIISPWNTSTNLANNGNLDLGYSGGRFKDLYLSGGVYLGGTGAANLLDDVEEGTWTPTIHSGPTGIAYVSQQGYYFKIGSIVFVRFYIQFTCNGGVGTDVRGTGLPYVQNTTGISWLAAGSIGGNYNSTSTARNAILEGTNNIFKASNDSTLSSTGLKTFEGTFVYSTTS
jgi:hypothetical protein